MNCCRWRLFRTTTRRRSWSPTDLAGADAQTVASTVTTPLARNFGEIPGLTQMTSSSGTEYSEITLQFDRSRTVDSVAQDVQAAINATHPVLARRRLWVCAVTRRRFPVGASPTRRFAPA